MALEFMEQKGCACFAMARLSRTPGCYFAPITMSCAGQAATLEAERDYAAGEAIAMDYGVGKLDSQVLLDHGVLDAESPQARLLWPLGFASAS